MNISSLMPNISAATCCGKLPKNSHCSASRLKLIIVLFFVGLLLMPAAVFATTNTEKTMDQAIGRVIGELMSDQKVENKNVKLFPNAMRTAKNYLKDNGFFLATVITYKRESKPQGFLLSGKVIHQDIMMRTIISHFAAAGLVRGESVEINKLTLSPVYMEIPRVAFFYVPDNGKTLQNLSDMSFSDALKNARKTARSLDGKHRPDRSAKNYIAALFTMEQLAEQEKITLKVPKDGVRKKGAYKSERGWKAVFVPVKIALDKDPEKFFSVSVSSPEKGTRHLFTYSTYSLTKKLQIALNKRGHNTGVPDGIFGANTKKAIVSFQRAHGLKVDGEQGLALLALVKRPDLKNGIELAQVRLKGMGYDIAMVDGKIGKKTRDALIRFQKDVGFRQDGSLTAETLNMLLILSDRKAPNSVDQKIADRLETKMWPNLIDTH